MDNKNIIICSDGTGNTTIKGRGTNVFKLFEAVDVNGHRSDNALPRQLAFYDDGVGTENLKWLRVFAGATGYGLSRNVKQLYRELCRVYEPGDAIYLFGFSRGAFTVRTLSGLINDCGMIDPADCRTEDEFRERARAAYKAYRRKFRALLAHVVVGRRGMAAPEFKARYARKDAADQPVVPAIRLLGVWDTVDAVGLPFALADLWNKVIWQYKFETTKLCEVVERGCHALALDDERAEFEPVIWNEDDTLTRIRVEQVWFSGAHSNVGGGYPQQGMSLVTLDWMMTHAEAQGVRFAAHMRDQYRTQHSFADKLYNPRSGLGVFYRSKPRDVAALCARRGVFRPKIHVSAVERVVQAPEGYAPGNIPPRCEVVTTESNPMVRLADVADAIAVAHGDGTPSSLLARTQQWVSVGLVAYATFLAGSFGALLRATWVMVTSSPDGVSGFFRALWDVDSTIPIGLGSALWRDPAAFSLLVTGLTAGYTLSSLSDRRMRQYYSAFWHRSRPLLREALRRTPASVPERHVTSPAFVGVVPAAIGADREYSPPTEGAITRLSARAYFAAHGQLLRSDRFRSESLAILTGGGSEEAVHLAMTELFVRMLARTGDHSRFARTLAEAACAAFACELERGLLHRHQAPFAGVGTFSIPPVGTLGGIGFAAASTLCGQLSPEGPRRNGIAARVMPHVTNATPGTVSSITATAIERVLAADREWIAEGGARALGEGVYWAFVAAIRHGIQTTGAASIANVGTFARGHREPTFTADALLLQIISDNRGELTSLPAFEPHYV